MTELGGTLIPAEHDKDETIRLLKLLGKLAYKLPKLKINEWSNIFEFIEYYIVVSDDNDVKFASFKWSKVKEILMLLDKID